MVIFIYIHINYVYIYFFIFDVDIHPIVVKKKKKWKYLRENYVREKRKPASGAAGGKKIWFHTNALRFLDDVLVNSNK